MRPFLIRLYLALPWRPLAGQMCGPHVPRVRGMLLELTDNRSFLGRWRREGHWADRTLPQEMSRLGFSLV